jgi:hypothetical protein
MNKRLVVSLVLIAGLGTAGAVIGQGAIMEMAANKVIQKYQSSSCEQLWQARGQPKSEQEQRVVNFLRNDPQARTEFINKIAGPVVNKMFECGLVP